MGLSRSLAVAIGASSLAALSALAQPAPAEMPAGERIYRRGVSASGQPITAIVQGDLRVRASDMPCVNCHRRSGFGTSEGPVTVPPVAGRVLFAPVTRGTAELTAVRTSGAGTRPAYTVEALLNALRDGIDPSGRMLSPTMPRYAVTEADVAALTTYLRSLSAGTPPGLTESRIHFATIVTDDVPAERRASMLEVLRAYVRVKNAGTRHEARRRERGPWDMKQHYQNYREWVLHEWVLRGDASEWAAQLEALYREQPVFALLGGLSDGDWTPIHEFSARRGIPAILPQAPIVPGAPADPFYSLYFTRGVALEAETLVRHLAQNAASQRVAQISRCGSAGAAAADMVTRDAPLALRVVSSCLEPGRGVTAADLRRLIPEGTNALVLWLDTRDSAAFDALASQDGPIPQGAEIYASSTLLGEAAMRLSPALMPRVSLLNTFVAPGEIERRAWRALTWFKANQVTPADRLVAVDAFYAAAVAGDALSMPGTLESREYFLERIEHMAGRSPNPSAHPGMSFDPTHRVGYSVCRIVKVSS